jgi:hypothetical protein
MSRLTIACAVHTVQPVCCRPAHAQPPPLTREQRIRLPLSSGPLPPPTIPHLCFHVQRLQGLCQHLCGSLQHPAESTQAAAAAVTSAPVCIDLSAVAEQVAS